MYLSSSKFLQAFSQEWRARLSFENQKIWRTWSSNSRWTRYMTSHGGLLDGVCKRASRELNSLTYWTEVYTVDALFVGGEDLFRSDLQFPSEVHALVEHENGPYVEEEMWKLLQWRCPLKVLIFYDYDEESDYLESISPWAIEKIESLLKMLQKNIEFRQEASADRYLFLMGQTATNDREIRWWWASDTSHKPAKLAL